MRFEVAPARSICPVPRNPACFILLDVRRVSKAPKGEIVQFLLFFCFTMKFLQEQAERRGISAQEVQ